MKDTPETIAYRLSQVEIAIKDLAKKMDNLAMGFATHRDVENAKAQAKLEHNAIYERVNDVELEVKHVEQEVTQLKKRNWVQNTLSAVLGAILTLLVTYVITDVLRR